LTPAKQGRRSGSRLDAHADYIVDMVEGEKDIKLNEMVLRLAAEGPYPLAAARLTSG
jgi:hypothetical protein